MRNRHSRTTQNDIFLVLVKCHLAMVRNCGGSEMILVKPWFRIINLDSNSIDMNLTNCTIILSSFWDYQQSIEISFFEILLFENYPTALEAVSLDWWEFDYLFEDFHFQILKLNFDVLYSPNELSSFVDLEKHSHDYESFAVVAWTPSIRLQ